MSKEKIFEVVKEVASDLDYLIDEVSIFFSKNNVKIFVKIDSLGAISHEDCSLYSQELSNRLKSFDVSKDYILEVSSPGINRELKSLDLFNRFKNAPVKVIYKDKEKETNKVIKGKIKKVLENSVKIVSQGEEIEIIFGDIVKANLDY